MLTQPPHVEAGHLFSFSPVDCVSQRNASSYQPRSDFLLHLPEVPSHLSPRKRRFRFTFHAISKLSPLPESDKEVRYRLDQCFSNCNVPPHQGVCGSADPTFCISDKLPEAADAAGSRTTLFSTRSETLRCLLSKSSFHQLVPVAVTGE